MFILESRVSIDLTAESVQNQFLYYVLWIYNFDYHICTFELCCQQGFTRNMKKNILVGFVATARNIRIRDL